MKIDILLLKNGVKSCEMEKGDRVDSWRKETLLFSDEEHLPLYPGCLVLGGVASSEDEVLLALRRKFCNDKLFKDSTIPSLTREQFLGRKYDVLKRMVELVGAQRRDEVEPALLIGLNKYCECIQDTGHHFEVDNPFFSCVAYVFPCSNPKQVVWIGFSRWATDVC